jgi:hypothetical protein
MRGERGNWALYNMYQLEFFIALAPVVIRTRTRRSRSEETRETRSGRSAQERSY